MIFFDTHTHINETEQAQIYNNAQTAGVKYLLATGADISSSQLSANFAQSFPNAFFSAGIHPHEAEKNNPDDLLDLLTAPKIVAIGETGLDYYYEFSNRKKQIQVFEICLELAIKFSLPAIIHCRDKNDHTDAYDDCFSILQQFSQIRGSLVMHSFTGSIRYLEKFLSLGAYISFNGIITFPKAENVRELLTHTPLDKILLETDSPYLAPAPHRGKTNEPAFLPIIAEKAAHTLNIPLANFANQCLENSFTLFKRAQK